MFKTLNVTAKHKTLKRKHRVKSSWLALRNNFLYMTPKPQATNGKIDKWDFIQMKNICASKNTIKRVKRQPTMGENFCKSYI